MGGKRERIPEVVREAIKDLRREGMSADKISKHAKELGCTVSLGAIYQICKGVKKGKAPKEKLAPEAITGGVEESPQQIVQEIKDSIDELHVSYVNILKGIRADLIRARARLQERKEK